MFVITLAFLILTLVLLFIIELGFRASRRRLLNGGDVSEPEKISSTFVMTLLGLLLAFSLSSARATFGEHSDTMLREAESIRIAKVALEQLDNDTNTRALSLMSEYVSSRKA